MKILIIRFSSIGDIVLTSSAVRCVQEQVPNAEIHFLTKKAYESLLVDNPRIHKVWGMKKSIKELIPELKAENFDFILDLHRNLRTTRVKNNLRRPSKSFDKLNVSKWLLTKLKQQNMPDIHVVDRYINTAKSLEVENDGKPGEFYIHPKNEVSVEKDGLAPKSYISLAMGAKFATKCLPLEKMTELLTGVDLPIALMGGKEDREKAQRLMESLPSTTMFNYCGLLNLQQSASVLKQSAHLLSHDTGLMHIGACFDLPITSVWGNTVPELGMYPYRPGKKDFSIHEVKGLSCRPCSKIGFQKCPKGHFNCMMQQDLDAIRADLPQ